MCERAWCLFVVGCSWHEVGDDWQEAEKMETRPVHFMNDGMEGVILGVMHGL